MAQEEVIKVLEKSKGEYMSLSEISEALAGVLCDKNVRRAIQQLLKYKEIKSIEVDAKIARKIYKKDIKNKIRLYYVDD